MQPRCRCRKINYFETSWVVFRSNSYSDWDVNYVGYKLAYISIIILQLQFNEAVRQFLLDSWTILLFPFRPEYVVVLPPNRNNKLLEITIDENYFYIYF